MFGCTAAEELDDLDISGTCNAFKSKYANKRLNYNESHNSKLSKPQCSEPLIRALSGNELSHLLCRDHAEQAQGRHLDIAALPVRGVQQRCAGWAIRPATETEGRAHRLGGGPAKFQESLTADTYINNTNRSPCSEILRSQKETEAREVKRGVSVCHSRLKSREIESPGETDTF